MPRFQTVLLTSLAMVAFAGNSLLCRTALHHTGIDALTFTTIRLVSGAAVLYLIVSARRGARVGTGNWLSALALLAYAAGFSFAYQSLSAATGALLLFGAVQATMMGVGLKRGERLHGRQVGGLLLALAGLVGLLLPGLSRPPLPAAVLMLGAGLAWGIYSLRGRSGGDPTRVTAGNFLRAATLAVVVSLGWTRVLPTDTAGIACAIASGAIASGLGYSIWYAALPRLRSTSAAVVQLSVPVLATLGGALLLGEAVTARVLLASMAILGGIALVIVRFDGSRSPR